MHYHFAFIDVGLSMHKGRLVERKRLRVPQLAAVYYYWSYRIGLILCFVLSCVWLWQKLYTAPILPITHVKITGDFSHITREHLKSTILPYINDGLLRFDQLTLQAQLLQNPWIETATIRRAWPDTVFINFTVRTAVARWGTDSLLDNHGYVFIPPTIDSAWMKLPIFQGSIGQQKEMIAAYQRMQSKLSSLQLTIDRVQLSPQHAWNIHLSNNLWIYLGQEQLYRRLQEFIEVYPHYLASQIEGIESVDLRYVHGMAIRFKKL